MYVSAVKQNEERSPLSTIVKATAIGAAAGYASKYLIGLNEDEKKNINYRAIINSSRKDANAQKAEELRALSERTPAQDTFVKMIDYRNADVKDPIRESLTAFEKDLTATFKDGFNQETFDEKLKTFSGKIKQSYSAAMEKRTKDVHETIDEGIENLGKNLSEIFKDEKGLDQNAFQKRLNFFNDKYIRSISEKKDVFSFKNVETTIEKLGKQDGAEFKRLVKEVNRKSRVIADDIVKSCHKTLKEKRLALPLITAGGALGFAAGFVHNMFNYTETEV